MEQEVAVRAARRRTVDVLARRVPAFTWYSREGGVSKLALALIRGVVREGRRVEGGVDLDWIVAAAS